ncbi:hypothetical protein JTB14_019191 [Gonioctena quinquepunctata]|nr:hypothetical protein JTB14_019191 [Gonioctena quinquepunctata]
MKYLEGKNVTTVTIGNMYRRLNKTVQLFSSLFGISICLTFLVIFTGALRSTNVLWEDLQQPSVLKFFFLMKIPLVMSGSILVIMGCEWATAEARRTVALCFKYQRMYPILSRERRELRNLAFEMMSNPIAFSALGLFDINVTTISTLFETAATYVILVIQLNNKQEKSGK